MTIFIELNRVKVYFSEVFYLVETRDELFIVVGFLENRHCI